MSGRHSHSGHAHASGTLRGGTGEGSDARALRIALGLIVGFVVLEVVAAFVAGSLALLADADHMLTDAVALATALWAIRLAGRPATGRSSFGLKRAEISAQHEVGAQ